MAKVKCPKCRRTVAGDDINVSANVVMCRSCGQTFKLSDMVESSSLEHFDVSSPPAGAWFDQRYNGFQVGASTRSWMALFIVPFTVVWAGGSLSGIYGTQLVSGKFDPMTSLFGLPFLLGSLALISLSAMMVMGKITITAENDRGIVFAGVGSIGWKRKFGWDEMTSIAEGHSRLQLPGGAGQAIVMEGKTRVVFGSLLNEARRYFVLQALKKMRSGQ